MLKLTALIVDDERLARNRIRRLLLQEPEVDVLGECANVKQAAQAMADTAPNLMLLDIQMPNGNGFELFGNIAAPAVILITAYEQYAVQAFEVGACDYLLKPVEETRLRASVARAREFLSIREIGAATVSSDALLIRSGDKISRIRVDSIDWLEAAGNYVRLHSGRESHIMRETLAAFEARLPQSRFARIHRTIIVNLERVVEFHSSFNGDFFAVLAGGKELRMSRTYRDRVRDLFGRSI